MRVSLPIAYCAAILLGLSGCGEELRLERRTVTFPNGKSVKEDWTFARKPNGDTLEHGVHKKFFWNGTASESVIWNMGKRDGSAQAWYDNGALKWQKAYDNGGRKGTWRLFYSDGQPWIIMSYEKDKLNGPVQVWSKTGGGEPKEAQFEAGLCKSGECALMDEPVLAPDAPAPAKVQATRDWEIVKDFLD